MKDLQALHAQLDAVEAAKTEPVSAVLNAKIGDIEKLVPALGGDVKGLSFLKEIPVVDVAASGIVAEFQSQDDIEKGWSPTEARSKDYGAAAVGLAAGAGTVLSVGTVATAAGVTAPVWLTVAGAGVAVVGVGDLAYQGFHEHWSEDIEGRGVWGGLKYGTADMFSNTGDTFKDLGQGIGGMATDVWHSIF